MPSLTRRIFERFENRTDSIRQTRQKMEDLLLGGVIGPSDIEHVYAGLFMELFTEFEGVLEELFFGLYSGSYFTRTYTIVKKSKITPSTEIQKVIYGGKSYVNWLPFKDNTLKRAKLFFDAGEPFCRLDRSEVRWIGNYQIIRNAIAHKSPHSLSKFHDLISDLTLLPSERTPTGYLRSCPSATSPTQSQFEIAVIELNALVYKLCL